MFKKINSNFIRFIIWVFAYLLFVYATYETSILRQELDFVSYLEGNLFSTQKYFFDVSIFFLSYLFVMKRPFHSVFFLSRTKENHLLHMLLYGFKICTTYIFLTMLFFYLIPFVHGFEIVITIEIGLSFLNLFFFVYGMYLIYILVLMHTFKEVISVFSGHFLNLIWWALLIIIHGINGNSYSMLSQFLLTRYSIVFGVILLIFLIRLRKRDVLT